MLQQVAVTTAKYPPVPYRYRWVSRVLYPERRGQRCRVVAWPPRNVADGGLVFTVQRGVEVEFMDGARLVGERGMVRLATAAWRTPGMDRRCRHHGCQCAVGKGGVGGLCRRHRPPWRKARGP